MEGDSIENGVNPLEVIQKRILISIGVHISQDHNLSVLQTFLNDASVLCIFAYVKGGETIVSTQLPKDEDGVEIISYLLRVSRNPKALNSENIYTETNFGVIRIPFLDSMLSKVEKLFAPTFFDGECWPDSIRNDFNSQLHRYLALVTDQKHRIDGKTVIYVPKEGLNLKEEVAARDKEYVSRLENAMIHWTRQIKDVLNAQETTNAETDQVGPLDEIQFWENRCNDLSGLSTQLDKPEVQKIQRILETAKSSYVNQFRKLSKQITQGNKQAQSNLKFLKLLDKPCKKLAKSHPSQIPDQLDDIIMFIRFIWTNSEFYNTRERLTSLFRKLSNEIIRICSINIDLDKIFNGHIVTSKESVQACIFALQTWKGKYKYAQKVHHKFSDCAWVLDQSSIFAQIDAFIQRCKDLLEICECQKHFARWENGEKIKLPIFHGQRGPEMARSLLEIEETFTKHVRVLEEAKHSILNVKQTLWHDSFTRFRNSVKDLEVMVQILLTSAFDSHQTIHNYVHVLEIFEHFSVRESIRRELDKKTKDMWFMFTEEVNRVKRLLAAKRPNLTENQPKFSGSAQWAKLLKRRVERPMALLERASVFLPKTGSGEEAKNSYNNLIAALDDFIRTMFQEWSGTVQKDCISKLDQPLMMRSVLAPELLDVNFDASLLKLFAEIHDWERLMFEIPHYAAEIYLKRDELRTLREHVLLVVRDYNRIITALNPNERLLFKERIRVLDKKITPGLTKLTWATKGISDFFINECRNYSAKVMDTVNQYKAAEKQIARKCKAISELLLVKLDGKTYYTDLNFGKIQLRHRDQMQLKINQHYNDIISYLINTSVFFARDGPDVYQKWVSYVDSVDGYLQEAVRVNCKNSLIELAIGINGNGKQPPAPLFKVEVILENNHNQASHIFQPAQVKFLPNFSELGDDVSGVVNQMSDAFASLTRLVNIKKLVRTSNASKLSFVDIIEDDEEIRKQRRAIYTGMQDNERNVNEYLEEHDKEYSHIYVNDKDAYVRRYEFNNPSVFQFQADINRFEEEINNVQKIETITTLNFVMLDCGLFKNSLISHCKEWKYKFQMLLKDMATSEYNRLIDYLRENAEEVIQVPQTLEELGHSVRLWEKLEGDKVETNSKIEPIIERFKVLESYDVTIEEEIDPNILKPMWIEFTQALSSADQMLRKNKDKFKSNLLSNADEFKRSAGNLLDNFVRTGPFTSSFTVEQAYKSIEDSRKESANLKKQQEVIKLGLAIFKIDQGDSKELAQLDEDLNYLERSWEFTKKWDGMWEEWKVGTFADLVTDNMTIKAHEIFKNLSKLSREIKDKNWDVVDDTRAKIQQLQRTMPLIQDLKNPAMRDRHWRQIKEAVAGGKRDPDSIFDENSDEFTLGVIIEQQLDSFAEVICDVSGAASKELSIEETLAAIEVRWSEIELLVSPYKDRGHFILKSVEEINQELEDNQVTLTTMKGSRYVKAFEKTVDEWERTLSLVMETIEMILQVQRQWLYLENIFIGEDIRKQLPKETLEFDDVNTSWKSIMEAISLNKNAKSATTKKGLLDRLNKMNEKLEQIQKSLDMYLETKRQIFPRFYFLSNDDLLEILGQSKNPEAVQPHLKKCFDNINLLNIVSLNHKKLADTMISCEDEHVPFKDVARGIDIQPVVLEGPVEGWLCEIERRMKWVLRDYLKKGRVDLKKKLGKRDKWVKEWPGQITITASQIQWTTDVQKALDQCKERGDKKPMKSVRKRQKAMLIKFSDAIRGQMTRNQRAKLVALITIEVHARDVIEKLIKLNCNDKESFDWLQQLRLYWDKDLDNCVVRQTNTHFEYGYEYLGNSGRLVITPLTDRCYVTLTTALHLNRGGSPKGPAGTGKTETVKDLGKALGMYVIVVNCSDGLDYKSMGRMFSGLAQTGAWGCFDEFNRINIEVLSVVAQQILQILSALHAEKKKFVFEGREIRLVKSCGIFITMNPGYAGRTELPDNLKSMFRPISMCVPDSGLIAEIMLYGEGFESQDGKGPSCKILAKKVHTLYTLAVQQLSKQDHYDFGLRALVSVLRYAGKKKRENPGMGIEEIMILAMKDMNTAKLTAVDLPLFNSIMGDLFPGVDSPAIDYTTFVNAINCELKDDNLQIREHTHTKILQLHETMNSRHSVMIVGPSGSGKSVTWKMLQKTYGRLKNSPDKETADAYNSVRVFPLNPKAVSLGELYGEFDLATNEWSDGVMSSVMRNVCSDDKPDVKWILFDGPVDTLWIESMNSVMDDNKILTLINGERISMPNNVALLFEVGDLSVASPATVSRCGMVYFDYSELGWRPMLNSWIQTRKDPELEKLLHSLVEKYFPKLFEHMRNFNDPIPVTSINAVQSFCRLFDVFGTNENGVSNLKDEASFKKIVELWFVFCMIWSICATLGEDTQKQIDTVIREMDGTFPNKDTIYEYYVDVKNKTWVHFEQKLNSIQWKYEPLKPFYKIVVPTIDIVRYDILLTGLLMNNQPVLLTGPVGTGKTSIATAVLDKMPKEKFCELNINLSAQTSSNMVQEIIESKVEKRTKGVYLPPGGKRMIIFLDDVNMPAKDTFGSQPPLELLRQWIDYGFWYDRQKQERKETRNSLILGAMGHPGGGRTSISQRFQSRFNLLNMVFPNDSQIKGIFGKMFTAKLADFNEEVKPDGDRITQATIELYQAVCERFLPTPAKIHYLFNLRDISKVFQGMLRAHKDFHDTRMSLLRLWVHECFRVFSDRLIESDQEVFVTMIGEKLGAHFDQTFHSVCPEKRSPIFGDFTEEDATVLYYKDLTDVSKLKEFMELKLEEYNEQLGIVPMDLVLFRDAMEHVTRIIRVIRQPRGNMLCIGIGGSGRQSLTRLAAEICGFRVFQIEVTKNYRVQEFHDDIKKLYYMTGVENLPTVFLFNDTQVVFESFLEDINNILSSGQVPNLYKSEDFTEVQNELSPIMKKEGLDETPDKAFKFFIDRVRSNLHIVLCMSPVGEAFRNRLRQYPGFISSTTIDLFTEWPEEALLEVGVKYLSEVDLGVEKDADAEILRKKLASTFATMHKSVSLFSKKMLLELSRHNYVTATNYLELVAGYKTLLYEKKKELGDQAKKLRNGLFKIDDTREKVEVMSHELADAKIKMAETQKDCEAFLQELVKKSAQATEQEKSVSATKEKIDIEAVKCKTIASAAQKDLDEAIPALEGAVIALNSLNKNDITEVKAYTKPPTLVETTMAAVQILLGKEISWAESKKTLGDVNFLKKLMEFNKEGMTDKVLKKIGGYCNQPDFNPDTVGRISGAAKSLCMWVRAMEIYGRIFRVVEPKKQRLRSAEMQLAEKEALLADAQAKLKKVQEVMEKLESDYKLKMAEKERLKKEAEEMEIKLDRAGKLISGLAGEKIRWQITAEFLEKQMGFLVGDCLIAAAFLSYAGPFLSEYRDEMVRDHWMAMINQLEIPVDPNFKFAAFLADAPTVRDWNIQGLPSDQFSTENGVIVTRGNRWPLMVDPQGQAIKWIKNMENKNGLKIIDLQMSDYMRTLENAIQFGTPVLLQNVQEELDPSLEPILAKALKKVGGRMMLKLGDKEIEFNPEFRFYITTKLNNPHYPPEISTKASIVNFAVKEVGLEDQLLGTVVRKERFDLEETKSKLVIDIASGKGKLKDLENEILRLLNESKGSLLDDVVLVNTLQESKVTGNLVTQQLEDAEKTEIDIDTAREGYRPAAKRASVLFFVINDLSNIDPMYQFSLDAYIDLFNTSIDKSKKSNKLEERIYNMNSTHTYSTYRSICRGLFEKHKLLFAFQMCAKIEMARNKINLEEYEYFLKGGVVLDREGQMDNPCPGWLVDASWDNITELDKLTNFHGIMASFEQNPKEWHTWFISAEPEVSAFPGEWENNCNELQRMVLVRSLRPDRVSFCATTFITNNLGAKFTEPPVLDMKQVFEESTPKTPLIFVLSAGVDPTGALLELAEKSNMKERFNALSLGQGQAPIATRMIKEGVQEGNWVFLANCHLSLSWMPKLDKLIENLQSAENTHPDFRLWLSSSPTPIFPIAILQSGSKMTTEPPKGLKANMKRLYQKITEDQFERCSEKTKYKKLVFGLCFFHSVLLERKKFLQLGWNINYGFNDSDFEVSENLLALYLDEYRETTPWEALKYLIAGVNYGGHITDEWDRRLLLTYINGFFMDEAISTNFFKLCNRPSYYIPKEGTLSSFREFIENFPAVDHPEAFGQHPNADIASQISDTQILFDTLLSLQPKTVTVGGESTEDKVLNLAADVYTKIPETLDYESTRKLLAAGDPSPLNVVLLQEIERYNVLLLEIKESLIMLQKAIQGLVVMSPELEEIFNCMNDGRVPASWSRVYKSKKPLGSWTRDLMDRMNQFSNWAVTTHPPALFNLGYFTFPTGFLTAVLQKSARSNNIAIDTLSWDFSVVTQQEKHIQEGPQEGVYIRGMYLEGASFDERNCCLIEPKPMQLAVAMPPIWFKPTETKKRASKSIYVCPVFYYSERSSSFVVAVDLKTSVGGKDNATPSEFWVKRGTAMLLSLDS